jgi:hypothetical protein
MEKRYVHVSTAIDHPQEEYPSILYKRIGILHCID